MSNQITFSTLDEKQKLEIKLEGIFSPDARKRRNEAYLSKDGNTIASSARFIHYTSAEAALKIISTKRIWMRNTNAMSDYREVQHGFDVLNKFFRDPAKEAAFISALDECAPGAAKAAIAQFNQWWNNIRYHSYVTSVSEHEFKEDLHGRLSMWRAFGGGNSARVGIVLNVPSTSTSGEMLKVMFCPVLYLDDNEANQVVPKVIANITNNKDFLRSIDSQIVIQQVFSMLLIGVTCLKHEGFKEEREWRAIYLPKLASSKLMEYSLETIFGVPQNIYKIPLDAKVSESIQELEFSKIFNRLIIGPSQYAWPMYNAFVEALVNSGVDQAFAQEQVRVSEIPIRT